MNMGVCININNGFIPTVGAPLVGAHSVDPQRNHQQTGQPQMGNHKGLPLRRRQGRKSIRLKNYDYSQTGLYFFTICVQNRLHLFGEIVNDAMVMNDAGLMIHNIWQEIPNDFKNIQLHEHIIMPNHFHGIIEIVGAPLVGAHSVDPQTQSQHQTGQPQGIAPTVGDIVGAFKSLTTNEYIKMVKQNILPPFNERIWQRNYWEHIIRNENEYNRIAQYILDNPQQWAMDKLNGGEGNRVMESSAMYGRTAVCLKDEVWMR